MSMELIPWQMMINLSEISSNYPISDPNYPEELSIPSITVNLTEGPLLTNSGNTNTFKEPWQTHFCWEQLHFWDILWHTTYYWVAILQCDNFAGNITIPRNSLDKIILIPLATTCENCKATCCLIQHIELECAESQTLEEYTLLDLDAQDPFLSADPLINANQNGSSQSFTQSEQLQHPVEFQQLSSADFPMESHSTNFPCTTTTGHMYLSPRYWQKPQNYWPQVHLHIQNHKLHDRGTRTMWGLLHLVQVGTSVNSIELSSS